MATGCAGSGKSQPDSAEATIEIRFHDGDGPAP
jgi:hypothetical protein